MKKINKFFFALASISMLMFTSCGEQENIQFDNVNGQTLVQFSSSKGAIPVKEGEVSSIDVNIEVSTVSSSDRSINLEIDPSTTAASNAYSMTSSVIIPAGEYSATATITGVYDNVPLSGSVDLVVNITGVEGSEPVFGNKTFTVTLERFCPSDLAGEYVYINGYTADVTVTQLSEGNYRVSRDNYFGSAYSFTINDRCNAVTITSSVIQDNFGIPTEGAGSVLANGDISITMTVDGYYAGREMIFTRK